jgi:hypothetical protein
VVKLKDGRPLSKQERIVQQIQLFTQHVRMVNIEKGLPDTTIDDYSLSNFTELCSAITSSATLLHIDVQTKLDVKYLNQLYSCVRDNRTVMSLMFLELAYKPEIPFNVNKFFQRNLSLPKIVNFIIENFKEADNNKNLRDIKVEDYSFLKYCLPSNFSAIEKGLASANFKGTFNLNQLVHEQFAFNIVGKDITNHGGVFTILPGEVHNLIFSFLDDSGIPCIGKPSTAADV